MTFDVVIPTIGRASLARTVDGILAGDGPRPERIIVVDGRLNGAPALPLGSMIEDVEVLRLPGAGPAEARNLGWRSSTADWVVFVDDDVVPGDGWRKRLADDLSTAERDVGGSQGVISVPLPADRRPTDWERNVAGLQHARWITADMAYRRVALAEVGGFDERFPRAFREDADIAARVRRAGWRLVVGQRRSDHPVRAADPWVSVRAQRGNADDVLLRRRYGRGWRNECEIVPGRRARHLTTTGALAGALVARLAGRRRAARLGLAAWAALTGAFAWERIVPGPRTRDEVATMVATSVVIPPAASYHWLRGWLKPARPRNGRRPAAVLFDRDGTLVVDVPYNGDPDRVEPMPGAREALERLRAEGVRTAVVSNQSGVARGLLTPEQVDAVNRRVEEILGPLGPWAVCPHGPDDGCACRKPASGLVLEACARLGVDPADVVVIGDIGADVEAARAAGARAVLVPTPVTRPEEVASAPVVAPDITTAVELALRGAA